nr:hypothetical protein [Tanacetum cinerariifolium]
MTHLVASLTLGRARSYVMQVTSSAPGKVSNIPTVHNWGGSISSNKLLPSILLLMVIGVAVVIVVVAIVMLVVVDGESSPIIKLSFVIIGGAERLAEECDRKQACFQGGKIHLGRNKSQGLNCGDNTRGGGRAIRACGDRIGGAARSAEECDRKRARFRGRKISLGRNKSRESNCGDNTRDGGRAIGA